MKLGPAHTVKRRDSLKLVSTLRYFKVSFTVRRRDTLKLVSPLGGEIV